MNNTTKKRLLQLEARRQENSGFIENGLPQGTKISRFEWSHPDPKICSALPKRGYCGEKVHIYSYNSADSVAVFNGESNIKLIKCGWCGHLAVDCSGANYWRFDIPSIRVSQNLETSH